MRHAKSIFAKSNRDKVTRRQPAMGVMVIVRKADQPRRAIAPSPPIARSNASISI
jgi:hypothetical protein